MIGDVRVGARGLFAHSREGVLMGYAARGVWYLSGYGSCYGERGVASLARALCIG